MQNRIKELRNAKGMTQKELAEKAKLSERQIIRIESEKSNTTVYTLENIATALNVTVSNLLTTP